MITLTFRRAVASACAFALMAITCAAAGFDEGSFETSSTPTPVTTQPAPGGGGGFDEGSFDPGGSSGSGDLAPPQDDPGTVVGGDDFPGGDLLPDTPQGGSVADQGGDITPAPTPAPTPMPQPAPAPAPDNVVDPQITAFETRDFGVPPQSALRQGQFHAPTPTALPGGYLVTTGNLIQAMNNSTPLVVIDVLGSGYGLPGAYNAPALASAGSFNDRTQQQAEVWLQQITNGNRDLPVVIYCSDPMCWLSYNASLRTVAAGYSQVYWYRGGVRAWQMVGLPLLPSGF